MPAPACRMMLYRKVTSFTSHNGQALFWLFGPSQTASPSPPWGPPQAFSRMFPSISTRDEFLDSSTTLQLNVTPMKFGSPTFHDSGLNRWLLRISISRGVTLDPAPPNPILELPPSMKLLTIFSGPAPVQAAIPWVSVATMWMSVMVESTTAR